MIKFSIGDHIHLWGTK